jgi:HrpA-like RNA helicase
MLPAENYREAIVLSAKSYPTTIVVGETGSGKSTLIPQFLLPIGDAVCCTQPRRIAAMTISKRVAFQLNVRIGEEVGYSVRFEDRTSKKTRLKFVTDGVLLRECMMDKFLVKYNFIIIDEAHERSLQTDILMGLIRNIQNLRSDLHVIVMSATLEVKQFQQFFMVNHL